MLSEKYYIKFALENKFSFFCKQAFKVIEPETQLVWNWHLDAVCDACEKNYVQIYPNLDINVPPRTMKSLLVNVLYPCWVWTKEPQHKFLSASRSYDLAERFNLLRRDLITSNWYQSFWKVTIREDANRIDEFKNTKGGAMKAISAMGKVTGFDGDTLLSDDLLDAMDAFSKTKRNQVRHWYSNAFYNRARNKKTVRRININQRLHQQDISSLLSEIKFEKLVLPMVKEEENRTTIDFVDPRKVGELLFPTRYGETEMHDDMKALGSYGWSSQYQQRPMPIGGGIIKEEWLRFYENKTNFSKKVIVADLSFKGNEDSDYNSIACWGSDGENRYLIDMIRGKWTYTKTKEMFLEFVKKHNASIKYIEDKANGSALLDDFKKEISGLRAWPTKGSKYAHCGKAERLFLCQSEFELGKVYLPKDLNIIEAYKEELLGFTENGSTTGNDDMIDTTTMAILELKKSSTFSL